MHGIAGIELNKALRRCRVGPALRNCTHGRSAPGLGRKHTGAGRQQLGAAAGRRGAGRLCDQQLRQLAQVGAGAGSRAPYGAAPGRVRAGARGGTADGGGSAKQLDQLAAGGFITKAEYNQRRQAIISTL